MMARPCPFFSPVARFRRLQPLTNWRFFCPRRVGEGVWVEERGGDQGVRLAARVGVCHGPCCPACQLRASLLRFTQPGEFFWTGSCQSPTEPVNPPRRGRRLRDPDGGAWGAIQLWLPMERFDEALLLMRRTLRWSMIGALRRAPAGLLLRRAGPLAWCGSLC